MILYGSLQITRLVGYKETIISMSVKDSHYDTEKIVSTDDGL